MSGRQTSQNRSNRAPLLSLLVSTPNGFLWSKEARLLFCRLRPRFETRALRIRRSLSWRRVLQLPRIFFRQQKECEDTDNSFESCKLDVWLTKVELPIAVLGPVVVRPRGSLIAGVVTKMDISSMKGCLSAPSLRLLAIMRPNEGGRKTNHTSNKA